MTTDGRLGAGRRGPRLGAVPGLDGQRLDGGGRGGSGYDDPELTGQCREALASFKRLMPDLDKLVDRVLEHYKDSRPSGILIEDASGRLSAELVWRMLVLKGGGDLIPVGAIRLSRLEGNPGEAIKYQIAALRSHVGDNPLVVTEYSGTGRTAVSTIGALKDAGMTPVYASVYAWTGGGKNRSLEQSGREAGAAEVLVARRIDDPEEIRGIHNSPGLNGVVGKGSYARPVVACLDGLGRPELVEGENAWHRQPTPGGEGYAREDLRFYVRQLMHQYVDARQARG